MVEVLSPRTEAYDRREKALAYPTAASFDAYLLVDPDRPVVEVGRLGPAGLLWSRAVLGDVVSTVAGELDVSWLYATLDSLAPLP